MLKNKNIFCTGAFLLLVSVFISCDKGEKGFISDNIYYIENPFTVQQGVTATSSPMVVDGSTPPLTVKILALRDAMGNDADSILTTPRSIVTFTGTITHEDSTLAMLKSKLKDSLVSPFNIGETGGRLQFTAATAFVPTGTYNMDVSVTNVRGARVLENACQINIQPITNTYELLYKRLRYWNNGTGDGGYDRSDESGITVNVNYTAGTTESKVIYKFLDKNNKVFSPAAGQIKRYMYNWPVFSDWDPYYTPVSTDTTLEYQFPNYGLRFPYFTSTVVQGRDWLNQGAAITYYQIPGTATLSGRMVQICTSLNFLASGTYVLTIKIPDEEIIL